MDEFKIFMGELREFFNASALEDLLEKVWVSGLKSILNPNPFC